MDAVVAGEGEGPLAPHDAPVGAILAATDPVALDLVALRLMGFDERKIPKVCEPMADRKLRVTDVRSPDDVIVFELDSQSNDRKRRQLSDIRCERVFAAHPGWAGYIERGSV
jgi:uncharacterized protein (DUF362 family)